jgi:hypothetical protein
MKPSKIKSLEVEKELHKTERDILRERLKVIKP